MNLAKNLKWILITEMILEITKCKCNPKIRKIFFLLLDLIFMAFYIFYWKKGIKNRVLMKLELLHFVEYSYIFLNVHYYKILEFTVFNPLLFQCSRFLKNFEYKSKFTKFAERYLNQNYFWYKISFYEIRLNFGKLKLYFACSLFLS